MSELVDKEDVLDVTDALKKYLDEIEASGFECYEHKGDLIPVCRCMRDDPLINCEGNQGERGSNLTPCTRTCRPFVVAGEM